ncbi:MAG: P-aminobenzoate N-oxygenase AurF [Gammaproteobacteria bacterium]|nr:P-aminobenzoate N-oxygenase AurF [Gammaproteobacteria bacterium]
MHPHLDQRQTKSLLDDQITYRKLEVNKRRNEEQDHTLLIDQAAEKFRYSDCNTVYWQDETFSLLYGTPVWEQASTKQRLTLNHLYWVAYYSQIISAEIATIFLNQVAAAGLYTLEDFRIVCDTLDLESKQERAHIHAFKSIGEAVEWELFGERLFTYPMRGLFAETMLFADTNWGKQFWRKLQLQAYTLLSANNAFLASQYLMVRGLRTLNGKLIQHQLANFYMRHLEQEQAPIPAAISYYHFMDESYHFNTSKLIGQDVIHSLNPPTRFESWVINRGITGCQKDHFHFSAAIRGIFWYEPALFNLIYKLFRSSIFSMDDKEARHMLKACFLQETNGLQSSFEMHRVAVESYKAFVESADYLSTANRDMHLMSKNSIAGYLKRNHHALARFKPA